VRKLHGTKVLGTFAPEERKFHRSESSMERKFLDLSLPGSECSTERKFHGCESSMERKFLEHSLLRSESSTGAKVPWNESSWIYRSPGANVPRNENSTEAKVLSMVFSLPRTKVQRNGKASYPADHRYDFITHSRQSDGNCFHKALHIFI